MCELMGLSASAPVDVTMSFGRLAAHGGKGANADGWGIAYLAGDDAQIWRDPHAAADSPFARFLTTEPVTSNTVIAHVRRATAGGIALANTQPFLRELFGRVHVFAHNGSFAKIGAPASTSWFRPLGETDSEIGFCRMLAQIAGEGDDVLAARRVFSDTAHRLSALGHANLLYASGDRLLVHSDLRSMGPDAAPEPGLWVVQRHFDHTGPDPQSDGIIGVQGSHMVVTVVASVPLTDEAWRPLPRGTVLEIDQGAIVYEGLAGADLG